MGHKHVVLTAWNAFVHLDDDGNPVTETVKHEAVMDVPEEQLETFLTDANQRWMKIDVTDDCPETCTAQLAAPDGEREARLQKATKLRENYHDHLVKQRASYEKANA